MQGQQKTTHNLGCTEASSYPYPSWNRQIPTIFVFFCWKISPIFDTWLIRIQPQHMGLSKQMEPNYVPNGSTLAYLSWSGVSLVLETNPMDGVWWLNISNSLDSNLIWLGVPRFTKPPAIGNHIFHRLYPINTILYGLVKHIKTLIYGIWSSQHHEWLSFPGYDSLFNSELMVISWCFNGDLRMIYWGSHQIYYYIYIVIIYI